ncbi:hypothetical protein ACH4GP_18280 [Streptomyces celluloflavus]|uniref:Uncharacterized protein n=1 Tax=Streptomyces celluloflavus TaxID=58344 RepID=A0ABW7RE36_9ACTN
MTESIRGTTRAYAVSRRGGRSVGSGSGRLLTGGAHLEEPAGARRDVRLLVRPDGDPAPHRPAGGSPYAAGSVRTYTDTVPR